MILQKFLEIGVGQGIFVPDLGLVCGIYSSLIFWSNPWFSGDGIWYFQLGTRPIGLFRENIPREMWPSLHPPKKGAKPKRCTFQHLILTPFFPTKLVINDLFLYIVFGGIFRYWSFAAVGCWCVGMVLNPCRHSKKMCSSVGWWARETVGYFGS